MNEKDIAKEILIKMIEHDYLLRDEFPNAETTVDMVCEAYAKIFTTVKEN